MKKYVLKFDDASEYPGQLVALDSASGGYPYAPRDPWQVHGFDSPEKALEYASSFKPGSRAYSAYAIEQKVYVLTATIELWEGSK